MHLDSEKVHLSDKTGGDDIDAQRPEHPSLRHLHRIHSSEEQSRHAQQPERRKPEREGKGESRGTGGHPGQQAESRSPAPIPERGDEHPTACARVEDRPSGGHGRTHRFDVDVESGVRKCVEGGCEAAERLPTTQVDARELLESEILDPALPPDQSGEVRVVADHSDTVAARVHIRLDVVGTRGERCRKREQCVLRCGGRKPAMGENTGERTREVRRVSRARSRCHGRGYGDDSVAGTGACSGAWGAPADP